jgi:hypothetical protein
VSGSTFVVGIDCAVDLKKVGAAFSVVKNGFRPAIENLAVVSAAAIAQRVSQAVDAGHRALLAFDSPLGWPSALGPALVAHRAGAPIAVPANSLFRREADDVVYALTKQRPLDVGADRIARTAHATLELLADIRRLTVLEIPLAWQPEFVDRAACIEVYPAATLRACGFCHSGYKGNLVPNQERRAAIISSLDVLLEISEDCCKVLQASDHALDAAVCVLAAHDFLSGRARGPEHRSVAEREGWAWVRSSNDA